MNFHFFLIASFIFLFSCKGQVNTSPDDPFQASHPEKFGDYWYAGEAELNRYELSQMRYGQEREGEAVLIFVSEKFLPEEQVKKEFGDKEGETIIKLNYLKKFVTGIYDYSIMMSAFTPVEFRKNPATLKVTFSSQDWCGQSFSQINLRDRQLEYQQRSYFQAEGDEDTSIEATYIEDDIWNRMRLEPQTLPMGEVEMVPSMEFLRLKHHDFKPYTCKANLFLQVPDKEAGDEFYSYELTYPELKRKLVVRCESRFPFKILGWEETWNLGTSEEQKTWATLKKTIKSPYWEKNGQNEKALRDSLGLEYSIR